MKRGRKKINCSLGTKKHRCFVCYDFEWQQLKIFFEKLKKERKKYYIKEE